MWSPSPLNISRPSCWSHLAFPLPCVWLWLAGIFASAAAALSAAEAALPKSDAPRAEFSTPSASAATSAPILCLGDSLTFGEGGDGVSYPSVLAARTGVPVINRGISGWIPRHLVYHVLLHEVATVTRAQLEGVPPAEYENRRHQPAADHLRTFPTPGELVWVREAGDASTPVCYRWDPSATGDSADTLKPRAVGDPAHRPAIATGRWRRESHPAGPPPEPKRYRGVVLCVGANGMEADDVARSLPVLLEILAPPPGRFLVLGLMNRVDPRAHPEDIAPWAQWIGECNAAIRAAYPDHFLDLEVALVRPAPRTREWFPAASAELLAADLAAHEQGVVAISLRASPKTSTTTHLNATGYTLIGTLVAEWTRSHGWYDDVPDSGNSASAIK